MKHLITLEPFCVEFECGEDETILSAALRHGIGLLNGFTHGACGSCKARIAAGEVDLAEASGFALMQYERDAGMALLCSAYPLEDIVVALEHYDEAELHEAHPLMELNCCITARHKLSPEIWQLALEIDGDTPLQFDAGQFVEVNVPGTDEWRAYSMANAPGDGRRIELIIKELPNGRFSSALAQSLAVGDGLAVRGPYGQFKVQDGRAPIVMVAGGSGMAPILSMLRFLGAERSPREIVFYYGVRSPNDLICSAEIAAVAATLPGFRYVPAVAQTDEGSSWDGEVGLVTYAIERLSGNLRSSDAYLCGPPAMIDAAIEVLKRKGMFGARMRFDKFVSTAS